VTLTRGALSVTDAVDFILQACEAVAEAHALGIIHRDLKPRNLFLTQRRDGKRIVKVLDFGLAKPIAAYGNVALTATTTVLGSPQYMSPEQMRSTRDVDFRTDVWSLGVCLYELITRRMPFEADTVPVLCALVLKDHPKPITHHRPDVPEALAQIVARCLEKDPAARYANVQQLAAALEPFGSSESRGASMRVSAVLHAAASKSLAPGDDAFGGDQGRSDGKSTQGIIIALLSLVLVLGLTGAILIALHFSREPASPDEPAATERAPAQATSAKSTLVTESTPLKADTSAAAEPAPTAPPIHPSPPPRPVQSATSPPPIDTDISGRY
jgi:serine/threonine-protein kinase